MVVGVCGRGAYQNLEDPFNKGDPQILTPPLCEMVMGYIVPLPFHPKKNVKSVKNDSSRFLTNLLIESSFRGFSSSFIRVSSSASFLGLLVHILPSCRLLPSSSLSVDLPVPHLLDLLGAALEIEDPAVFPLLGPAPL